MLFGRFIARTSLKYHFIIVFFGVVADEVSEVAIFEGCPEAAGTRLLVAGDRAFNILPRWPPGGAKIVATKQFHIIPLTYVANEHYGRGDHRL